MRKIDLNEGDIEVVASLTIRNAAKMSKAEKQTVADWLREQATDLTKDGWNYSGRFTARHYGHKY